MMTQPIHENQPVLQRGAPLAQARAAMILVHGRGARAEDILSMSAEFAQEGLCFLAPQAIKPSPTRPAQDGRRA